MSVRKIARWLLLALGAHGTAQSVPVVDPLAAVLAPFADDGLPALIARLERREPAVYAELAALGPAAHEALLGMLGRCDRPRDDQLLAAFGGFDAQAAWALPLLLDEFVLGDPVAQELLYRLGPAAAPALPELRTRAAGKQPWLVPIVARLARATDTRRPAGAPPMRPRVDRQLVPALLERLASPAAVPRWPVLQALLAAGDEASTAAFEVLHRLTLQAALAPTARELLLALRSVYGARCLQGIMPLPNVATPELPAAARRLVLGGRSMRQEEVRAWVLSADPALRRTGFLAQLESRYRFFGDQGQWLTTADADADVQRAVELVRQVDRAAGARTARQVLSELPGSAPEAAATSLTQLAGFDLCDAPAELWPLLCTLASGPGAWVEEAHADDPPGLVRYRRPTPLGRAATNALAQGAGRGHAQPVALTAALPLLQRCRENQQLLRELLAAAELREVETCIRRASEEPPQLARWIGFLRGADSSARVRQVFELVGPVLGAGIAVMPATTQLDWLELGPMTTVAEPVWAALLRSPEVAVRRRAIDAAWRGFHQRPIDLALAIACLEDADVEVARTATFLLAACRTEPERAVAALMARFPAATVELQAWLVRALYLQHEHRAAARATFVAAFASEAWQVRLPAACALLALEPEHGPAFALLAAMVDDERAEVRRETLWSCSACPPVAARFVDLAIDRLDDAEDEVRYGAVRLLGVVRSAKDRSLPALRAFLDREGRGSAVQRAQSAIAELEKQDEPSPPKR